MLLMRKTMAAIKALLKKRKLFWPKVVKEAGKRGSKASTITKGAKPGSENHSCEGNWLILLKSGLDEVRAVTSYQENSHERILFLVLDSIGILRFLVDVWQWQSVEICQEFVSHWDHKSRTTTACGVHIDASYQNFITVTGFEDAHDSAGSSNQTLQEGDGGERQAFVCVDEPMSISRSLLYDPVLQSLLSLLSRTLWFAKKQSCCPTKDMVYLLVESMRGHKLEWSKCVYEKFICEIRELQDRHYSFPDERIQTLAGPLMCFLYAHEKQKAQCSRGNSDLEFPENWCGDNDSELWPFPIGMLKLPLPPKVMSKKRGFEHSNLGLCRSDTAHELAAKTLEDGQMELARNMAEELSTTVPAEGGIEVTRDLWEELNEAFEE